MENITCFLSAHRSHTKSKMMEAWVVPDCLLLMACFLGQSIWHVARGTLTPSMLLGSHQEDGRSSLRLYLLFAYCSSSLSWVSAAGCCFNGPHNHAAQRLVSGKRQPDCVMCGMLQPSSPAGLSICKQARRCAMPAFASCLSLHFIACSLHLQGAGLCLPCFLTVGNPSINGEAYCTGQGE